jgi:hypothetical protein
VETEEIAKVLVEDSVLTEQRILVWEVSFCLKGMTTKISARIYRALYLPNHLDDKYEFELSHYMHTPKQLGPYLPSAPYTSDPNSAMRRAVSALTMYYNEAVKTGLTPSDDWLVEA